MIKDACKRKKIGCEKVSNSISKKETGEGGLGDTRKSHAITPAIMPKQRHTRHSSKNPKGMQGQTPAFSTGDL